MRCKKCKKTIAKNSTACPFCSAPVEPKQPMKTWKKWVIGIACSLGAIILAVIVVVVSFGASMLGKINRESELSAGEVAVNSELLPEEQVKNIALFGLDTEKDVQYGRSDAIIVLSIDRVHNKIKLTSFARDTVIPVRGKPDKFTHAFAYGGAKLAVKTLNEGFDMNVTDYAFVNFFEFVKLIDYLGGVELDVNASEMRVMNTKYIPELNELGIACEPVTKTGMQHLSGGQALAYSRDRYTGSELERGNRHKEVINAVFQAVKDTPVTKFPSMISRVLELCHTSLTNSEMLSLATWAATAGPSVEQFGLPSKECNAFIGNRGDGLGSVVAYDLDLASDLLYQFIYEQEPAQ